MILEMLIYMTSLRKSGICQVRIYFAYRSRSARKQSSRRLKKIAEAREHYHDEWLSAGAVKFYMDGVIESHTAAMLTPYSDDPKQIGALFWDPAKYKDAVRQLDRRGFQIFTHGLGTKLCELLWMLIRMQLK